MNTLNSISEIILIAEGKEVNITKIVLSIELTEDLFSPYPMGYMLLEDVPSTNFNGLFPPDGIVGKGEEFTLKFMAKIGSYVQELQGFHIYKVEPIISDSNLQLRQKVNYKLHFSTRVFFVNELKLISKFYDNKKLSEVVKEIAEKDLQITLEKLDETHRKQSIFFPYLSPIECIIMCSSRSITKENIEEANYTFYGDLDHKFYYVSLGTLLKGEPVIGKNEQDGITITMPIGTNFQGTGKIDEGPTKYYSNRYKIKPISPYKDMIQSMYSSSLLEFDSVKRKYKKYKFNYQDNFKKTRHLVDRQIVSPGDNLISKSYSNPDAFFHQYISCQWIHNEDEKYEESDHSTNNGKEYILKRKSQIQQLTQMGVELEIPGNAVLKIGQVLFFGRPQLDQSGTTEAAKNRNPHLVGKYLVTRKTSVLESSSSNNTTGFNLKTVFSLRKDSDLGIVPHGSGDSSASSEVSESLDIGASGEPSNVK